MIALKQIHFLRNQNERNMYRIITPRVIEWNENERVVTAQVLLLKLLRLITETHFSHWISHSLTIQCDTFHKSNHRKTSANRLHVIWLRYWRVLTLIFVYACNLLRLILIISIHFISFVDLCGQFTGQMSVWPYFFLSFILN